MTDETLLIRPVEIDDVDELRPVFEEWVRSLATGEIIEAEVEEDLEVTRSIARGEQLGKRYYVATLGGKVLGGMGFKVDPYEQVIEFAKTERPVEIVNAYISREARRRGVGRALVQRIREDARALGYQEVLVNSGPRYEESGWGFYDKVIGVKLGFIANFYGEGFDAAVWGEVL